MFLEERLKELPAMGAGVMRAAVLLSLLSCSFAYYLPGTYPQEFFLGQTVQGTRLWVYRCKAFVDTLFRKVL